MICLPALLPAGKVLGVSGPSKSADTGSSGRCLKYIIYGVSSWLRSPSSGNLNLAGMQPSTAVLDGLGKKTAQVLVVLTHRMQLSLCQPLKHSQTCATFLVDVCATAFDYLSASRSVAVSVSSFSGPHLLNLYISRIHTVSYFLPSKKRVEQTPADS